MATGVLKKMKPTNVFDPGYFHKVVDCQWACPAHTPVPEYIRLIADRRYSDAYMVNWQSNVFPGILGRVCDRPCEPACRRQRTEDEPVAICRLKRVAADNKGDISEFIPKPVAEKNGKRIALIGAGPASLSVARDLLPLGYEVVMFDAAAKGGGMMRSQIPAFRLPIEVLDEEVELVTNMGLECHYNHYIESLGSVLEQNFDAVFVGTGAPKGKDLNIPGREIEPENLHIGIDWLDSVAFGHRDNIGEKVLVIGGGNTAMDCCRTSRRLGGKAVKVMVRRGLDDMKASPWEKVDAMGEDIPILDCHVPQKFVIEDNRIVAMTFQRTERVEDENGKISFNDLDEDPVVIPCDDVILAIGQDNHFPWIERDIGMIFDPKWDMPEVDKVTYQSSIAKVFFGGDAAFGPENIITAVAHGHQAAISIHYFCQGLDLTQRPAEELTLVSQKMGLHEWSYSNDHDPELRQAVPHENKYKALSNLKVEVELGFDQALGAKETQRCLNCDMQTVFSEPLCIECDACVDICPTDCISFTANNDEPVLRQVLKAPADNVTQDLYVSDVLPTERVMVKDEDVCLHCGLCAERCPTGAWDMQKSDLLIPQVANVCGS